MGVMYKGEMILQLLRDLLYSLGYHELKRELLEEVDNWISTALKNEPQQDIESILVICKKGIKERKRRQRRRRRPESVSDRFTELCIYWSKLGWQDKIKLVKYICENMSQSSAAQIQRRVLSDGDAMDISKPTSEESKVLSDDDAMDISEPTSEESKSSYLADLWIFCYHRLQADCAKVYLIGKDSLLCKRADPELKSFCPKQVEQMKNPREPEEKTSRKPKGKTSKATRFYLPSLDQDEEDDSEQDERDETEEEEQDDSDKEENDKVVKKIRFKKQELSPKKMFEGLEKYVRLVNSQALDQPEYRCGPEGLQNDDIWTNVLELAVALLTMEHSYQRRITFRCTLMQTKYLDLLVHGNAVVNKHAATYMTWPRFDFIQVACGAGKSLCSATQAILVWLWMRNYLGQIKAFTGKHPFIKHLSPTIVLTSTNENLLNNLIHPYFNGGVQHADNDNKCVRCKIQKLLLKVLLIPRKQLIKRLKNIFVNIGEGKDSQTEIDSLLQRDMPSIVGVTEGTMFSRASLPLMLRGYAPALLIMDEVDQNGSGDKRREFVQNLPYTCLSGASATNSFNSDNLHHVYHVDHPTYRLCYLTLHKSDHAKKLGYVVLGGEYPHPETGRPVSLEEFTKLHSIEPEKLNAEDRRKFVTKNERKEEENRRNDRSLQKLVRIPTYFVECIKQVEAKMDNLNKDQAFNPPDRCSIGIVRLPNKEDGFDFLSLEDPQLPTGQGLRHYLTDWLAERGWKSLFCVDMDGNDLDNEIVKFKADYSQRKQSGPHTLLIFCKQLADRGIDHREINFVCNYNMSNSLTDVIQYTFRCTRGSGQDKAKCIFFEHQLLHDYPGRHDKGFIYIMRRLVQSEYLPEVQRVLSAPDLDSLKTGLMEAVELHFPERYSTAKKNALEYLIFDEDLDSPVEAPIMNVILDATLTVRPPPSLPAGSSSSNSSVAPSDSELRLRLRDIIFPVEVSMGVLDSKGTKVIKLAEFVNKYRIFLTGISDIKKDGKKPEKMLYQLHYSICMMADSMEPRWQDLKVVATCKSKSSILQYLASKMTKFGAGSKKYILVIKFPVDGLGASSTEYKLQPFAPDFGPFKAVLNDAVYTLQDWYDNCLKLGLNTFINTIKAHSDGDQLLGFVKAKEEAVKSFQEICQQLITGNAKGSQGKEVSCWNRHLGVAQIKVDPQADVLFWVLAELNNTGDTRALLAGHHSLQVLDCNEAANHVNKLLWMRWSIGSQADPCKMVKCISPCHAFQFSASSSDSVPTTITTTTTIAATTAAAVAATAASTATTTATSPPSSATTVTTPPAAATSSTSERTTSTEDFLSRPPETSAAAGSDGGSGSDDSDAIGDEKKQLRAHQQNLHEHREDINAEADVGVTEDMPAPTSKEIEADVNSQEEHKVATDEDDTSDVDIAGKAEVAMERNASRRGRAAPIPDSEEERSDVEYDAPSVDESSDHEPNNIARHAAARTNQTDYVVDGNPHELRNRTGRVRSASPVNEQLPPPSMQLRSRSRRMPPPEAKSVSGDENQQPAAGRRRAREKKAEDGQKSSKRQRRENVVPESPLNIPDSSQVDNVPIPQQEDVQMAQAASASSDDDWERSNQLLKAAAQRRSQIRVQNGEATDLDINMVQLYSGQNVYSTQFMITDSINHTGEKQKEILEAVAQEEPSPYAFRKAIRPKVLSATGEKITSISDFRAAVRHCQNDSKQPITNRKLAAQLACVQAAHEALNLSQKDLFELVVAVSLTNLHLKERESNHLSKQELLPYQTQARLLQQLFPEKHRLHEPFGAYKLFYHYRQSRFFLTGKGFDAAPRNGARRGVELRPELVALDIEFLGDQEVDLEIMMIDRFGDQVGSDGVFHPLTFLAARCLLDDVKMAKIVESMDSLRDFLGFGPPEDVGSEKTALWNKIVSEPTTKDILDSLNICVDLVRSKGYAESFSDRKVSDLLFCALHPPLALVKLVAQRCALGEKLLSRAFNALKSSTRVNLQLPPEDVSVLEQPFLLGPSLPSGTASNSKNL